jgi:hypothetical protein
VLDQLGVHVAAEQEDGARIAEIVEAYIEKTHSLEQLITSTFEANMVLVSARFEEETDVGFENLWIEYPHLDE